MNYYVRKGRHRRNLGITKNFTKVRNFAMTKHNTFSIYSPYNSRIAKEIFLSLLKETTDSSFVIRYKISRIIIFRFSIMLHLRNYNTSTYQRRSITFDHYYSSQRVIIINHTNEYYYSFG